MVFACKRTHGRNLSLQTDLSCVYLARASLCAHVWQSECSEYLQFTECNCAGCVCVWGYAGWSRGPVRHGQMVPGGWLSSWWPSWWCRLWSLLIRYARLPESPAPSRCLSFCLSHCSQFVSMCLLLMPICITNTHTHTVCVSSLSLPSHTYILPVYDHSQTPQLANWPAKNLQAVTSHTLSSNLMEASFPAHSISILLCHLSDLLPYSLPSKNVFLPLILLFSHGLWASDVLGLFFSPLSSSSGTVLPQTLICFLAATCSPGREERAAASNELWGLWQMDVNWLW